jgi:hypothetical protein
LADRVLLKIVYLLVRRILGLAALVSRTDLAKDAELLVLRHENAVLRRHAGRVRYEPADRVWFAALPWLLPRRRWTEVFAVTPATLLAWHRKLAASKYDTSSRRKPGRPAADGSQHRPVRCQNSRKPSDLGPLSSALVLFRLLLCVPRISSVGVTSRVALPAARP